MKSALIFGANGQDGYYLSELCKLKGIEPICISRTGTGIQADVSQYVHVESLIKKHLPTYVFHLAANSTTRHDTVFENHGTIATGTLNILESVKKYSPATKVFITGSGLQFKNIGNPISESAEFEANNPYNIARIQSVYAARYYRSLGIRAYVGYLFHHESPLRKPIYVSKKISLAVQHIAAGSHETEWAFAGDVVEAMMILINQDVVFEAVIGSGKAYSIEYWLECCFKLISKNWRDYVTLNNKFETEYHILVSNPTVIKSIGWQIKKDINDVATMMVISGKP
jgi:GDPmannose 4,6-dehydratase